MVHKVISGGQCGTDIALLRAAKKCGIATGGAMPKGFRTEAGDKPEYRELFGMHELTTRDYPSRTRANAQEANVTYLIAKNLSSPGSRATIREVRSAYRQLVQCDIGAGKPFDIDDPEKRATFVQALAADLWADDVDVINFAGNRDADEAQMEQLFVEVFTLMQQLGKGV